jgi:dTDP-4-amino-4,6-dideoxygalactose transaminase
LRSANSDNLPVATKAASQVICLPIYPALTITEQQQIIDVIQG